MDKFAELQRCVLSIEKDASKFFGNGNKAAGTRARKHLQELKTLAQELRVIIQETKNEKTTAAPAFANGGAHQADDSGPVDHGVDDDDGAGGYDDDGEPDDEHVGF